MMRPMTLVVAFAAVVVLIWLSWEGAGAPDPTPPPSTRDLEDADTASAAADADAEAGGAVDARATGATARDAVATPPSAKTGSLLLTVVWDTDGSPVVGIDVEARLGWADHRFLIPSGKTNELGQFLFEGLSPGQLRPAARRVEPHYGKPVEILAGQVAELLIKLEAGLAVSGRVVDLGGEPIAGADIAVTGWGGGRSEIVAESAADGTFAVRGLPNSCHVGARKRGYCPTVMRTVTTKGEAAVELTIVMDKVGGSLTGVVFGPAGVPVKNAKVRVGVTEQRNHQLPDGGSAMGPQPVTARTDAHGRFEVASVAPGPIPVTVRGEALAPWSNDIEIVAGRPTQITVHLLRGAVLSGTVKDRAGEPVGKTWIYVQGQDRRERRSMTTAADGTYRFEGLALGELTVRAQHDDEGSAKASFEFAAGEERQWDPVLSAGLQVRGRVVDCEGNPVAGATVESMLHPWQQGKDWFAFERTDKDGRFTLSNCIPDHTIRISVRRKSSYPEALVRGIMPGAEPVEIRLPEEAWVYIAGTVLGPEGRVLPNVNASPLLIGNNSGGVPVEAVDPETGKFKFGPYPPGEFRVTFRTDGFPRLRIQRALRDETWDVGELRFERGGTLAVQLVPDSPGANPGERKLSIYKDGEYADRISITDNAGRSGPLVPGDYELAVKGGRLAAATVPFTIRSAAETKIDVPITVGVAVSVVCELPVDEKGGPGIALVVRDAAGRVAYRDNVFRADGVYKETFALRSGTYSMTATLGELTATEPLSVAGEKTAATLELR